jgi:hypothetical protein
VLKEFNRQQDKWRAILIVSTCEHPFCKAEEEEGDKVVSYLVWVRERRSDDLVAEVEFSYNLTKGIARILSVGEVSDHHAFSLHEVYDFLAFALKLAHTFYMTHSTRPTVTLPRAKKQGGNTTTPEQANKDVFEKKQYFREQFTAEDLARINELRFKLTKVLREFNRQQRKWLAWLEVEHCFICKEGKIVFYDVWVLTRDTRERVARVTLDYNLTKNVKGYLSIGGALDGYVLGFNEFCDILALALRLIHTFQSQSRIPKEN